MHIAVVSSVSSKQFTPYSYKQFPAEEFEYLLYSDVAINFDTVKYPTHHRHFAGLWQYMGATLLL